MGLFKSRGKKRHQNLKLRVAALEAVVRCSLEDYQFVLSDEIGFNGQCGRKEIVRDLLASFPFEAIVETGTWIGNTTGYLAKTTGLPIYTTEMNDLFYAVARKRLSGLGSIHFHLQDSRSFLRDLKSEVIAKNFVFIYLDAHWHEDLPLREEIKLVAETWERYVIMIDDFGVPFDQGYRYDDYGRGKTLHPRAFKPIFRAHRLESFYPRLPSSEETGERSGCVVLAPEGELAQKMERLKTLRRD
jgi:hypothetical protein